MDNTEEERLFWVTRLEQMRAKLATVPAGAYRDHLVALIAETEALGHHLKKE